LAEWNERLGTTRFRENDAMRSYRQLAVVLQSMRTGKSAIIKETDNLLSIYDRIARKGNRGNS
jgi:hypothetical protein